MFWKRLNEPLTLKPAWYALGVLLMAAVLLWGSRAVYRQLTHQPPTPAQVRAALWGHLQEQAGQDEFRKDLPALTNTEPATLTRTNAAGKVKVIKLKKKDVANPQAALTREFRKGVAEATDYKTIYRLIGEQLTVAEKQLASADPPQREAGLLSALEAIRGAQQDAADVWLGARISEAYLWPCAQRAEFAPSAKLSAQTILEVAERAFRLAGETDNLIRNCRLILRASPQSNRADHTRFRLAKLLEQEQDFAGALQVLREVQGTNNPALAERIARLEQQVQARR